MTISGKRRWPLGSLAGCLTVACGLTAVAMPQQSGAIEPAAAVTHGDQLQRADLGPQGTLTQRPGFATSAPTTLSRVQINGGVEVKHDFSCTDCRIIGSPSRLTEPAPTETVLTGNKWGPSTGSARYAVRAGPTTAGECQGRRSATVNSSPSSTSSR